MPRKKNKQTKHKKNKLHYKPKQCTPFHKDKLPFTCLSKKALLDISNAANKVRNNAVNVNLPEKELYKQLCEFIESEYKCKNEGCWLTIKELMKHLQPSNIDSFKDHFRPKLPKELEKDYTNWLSNFDIENVLQKHHNNINDFYFLGVTPIDFRKCSVSQELCNLDIKKHRSNGINKMGIVFNTDESSGPGEHWMAMYIDLSGQNLDKQPGIYFFDSFGSDPSKEIKELIKEIKNSDKQIDYFVSHNDKSFQDNTYACGFYCMHFIEHMLEGYPFRKYLQSGINDETMKRYIYQCYLNPKEIKC